MKLENLAELHTDDYVGYVYGPENQLEVFGWSGKQYDHRGKGKKLYLSHCKICAQDPELFGNAVFSCTKSAISAGQIPCGCSKKPVWTEAQLMIRVDREAIKRGYRFLGFSEPYNKATTKLILECPEHGVWTKMAANNFFMGQSCPCCSNRTRSEILTNHNILPDEYFINMFIGLKSHYYCIDFKRSGRISTRGRKEYWSYFCTKCEVTAEALASNIINGSLGCDCSRHSPTQGYIKILEDSGLPIAIKFGIANTADKRKHRNCIFDIKNHSYWNFPDKVSCRKAEKVCLERLPTSVINKQEMPDGYTETTYVNKLQDIIDIYKSFGGEISEEFSYVICN